jgi:hypothetical protein
MGPYMVDYSVPRRDPDLGCARCGADLHRAAGFVDGKAYCLRCFGVLPWPDDERPEEWEPEA